VGSINPISNQDCPKFGGVQKKITLSTTASKVNQLIIDLKKNWSNLSYDQIADKLIEVQDLGTKSPSALKKIQNLHFNHQFPIESDRKDFACEIRKLAERILRTDSVDHLSTLDLVQQKEIIQFARGNR